MKLVLSLCKSHAPVLSDAHARVPKRTRTRAVVPLRHRTISDTAFTLRDLKALFAGRFHKTLPRFVGETRIRTPLSRMGFFRGAGSESQASEFMTARDGPVDSKVNDTGESPER